MIFEASSIAPMAAPPSSSSPPPLPASSTSSSPSFAPHTFSNPVSFKLIDDNFTPWQQEAIATIKGHKLQNHLHKDKIPLMYSSDEDAAECRVNPEFLNWKQQDNLLLSWLLASLSESVRIRMVGCVFAYQVWEKDREVFCITN